MTTTRSASGSPVRRARRGDPVWELARMYPNQGEWTEAEYLSLDSKRLIELAAGCLEFPPMPTLLHQRIVLFIYELLKAHVAARRMGEVFVAPVPVRIAAGTYREPDVFFLKPARLRRGSEYPDGADLVVEIVSGKAEDRRRDLSIKRTEYAAAHIPEYWIVDPKERHITVLTLAAASYREHGLFRAGERATSRLLPGFSVDVDAVFAAGRG